MKKNQGLTLDLRKEQTLLEPGIRLGRLPQKITIPLVGLNHTEALPCVSLGQKVLRGQKIAEGERTVFSSVSGEVIDMSEKAHPLLGFAPAIEIESDRADTLFALIGQERTEAEIASFSASELLEIFRESGLEDLGRGGAGLFSVLAGIARQALVLDASECEPYITADQLLMMCKPVEILKGLEWMIRASGACEGIIAVSKHNRECYELFASKIFTHKISRIRLVWLEDIFPQAYPAQLQAAFGSEISILNVASAFATYEAVKWHKPFMERVVTLAGSCLMQPQNVWARLGVSFKDLIESHGGFLRFPASVLMGGPMTGVAQDSLDVPVIASTNGILALPKEEVSMREAGPCIRCGDCIPVCPVSLNPAAIMLEACEQKWTAAQNYSPEICVECGNCSAVCPSYIPVREWVKQAKNS
ncbi:MAG: RnfABCDGE type electron transport complex subunit C [Candidatus Omnitrophica bacterium]|nr:RnfABCDGE type electron transport complex subunit C [Candidatus Omnitrophota bacterium]